jgi:predicted deacylase
MPIPVSYTFDSGKPGPKLLVFGAVHGNEVCGTVALARLKLELELGIHHLKSGTLTMVPVCNPLAYAAGKRFVDENLNRIVTRQLPATNQERGFAYALMDLIDRADILLDLHSYSAGAQPFISYDYASPQNEAIARSFGIEHWVTGWAELYAGSPDLNAGDTIQYAAETGKPGVLVECGQHDDPASITVAYRCVRGALATLGMMSGMPGLPPAPAPVFTKLCKVYPRDREGVFARPWQNFDTVAADEPVINYANGETLRAEADSVIIFPDARAAPGREWIYLGERQT